MSPLAALYLDWVLTAMWPISGKLVGRYAHPLVFGAVSLALGALALAPWLARAGRWRRLFDPALVPAFLILGGVGSGVTTFLLLWAVSLTTPGNAAIVCQIEVVYSAVLASWLLGERITWRQGAASALVVAGTALILLRDLGTPHWKGDAILLGTVWMFQLSHIVGKRLPADLDYVTLAGARLAYGAAALALPAAWVAWTGAGGIAATAPSLALLAFHSLILNAVNITLWYVVIRNLELSKSTAFMLSYPALTLVYSWALGQEAVNAYQVAGLAVSMAGAVWLTFQFSPQSVDDPLVRTPSAT